MSSIEDLEHRFGREGHVHIITGEGGLPCVQVTGTLADATIYLNGACVTHYQAKGQTPLLFCSRTSKFEEGKAIRGGIPMIFPWFGPHPTNTKLPQHGFVRNASWELVETEVLESGEVAVVFQFNYTPQTLNLWNYSFALRYKVEVGSALHLTLETFNLGTEPFQCEQALHTYFTVSHIRNVHITGLEDTEYIDKVDGGTRKRLSSEPFALTGETDRVFVNTASTCRIHDAEYNDIIVEKSGSLCTVVWNPWETKAEAMADLGGGQWAEFLCVESVNSAEHAVEVAPDSSHVLEAKLYRVSQ